jgi:hypothetical protein
MVMDPLEIAVQAHRIDRKADPVEYTIRVPAANELTLGEGVWELRLVGHTAWGPRVYVRNGDSVSMPVWPAVRFRAVANGVTALNAAFKPLHSTGATGETSCDKDGMWWICAIPPGHYDLRFSSPGWAPEYRFDVTVPFPAEMPLRFVAGASLAGRLGSARGAKISLEDVDLSLIPAGGTAHGERYTTKSTARGFFQFTGLPPGEYSLSARRKGLTAPVQSVTIVAGMAAELSAPLLLDRPKRLTVTLVPSLDPDLKPWRVSLWSFGMGPQRPLTAVSESAATPNGDWTLNGLIAGDYRVYVSRANGQMWVAEDASIVDADVAVPLTVFGERVTGMITLGDRPLAAKLSFGGEGGLTLESNEEGRFEGEIPPDDGDERTIHVDAGPLDVIRTVRAKLERSGSGERHITIRLPATALVGRVVLADGSPESGAIVTVNRSGQIHQTFSKDDGSFQLTGIDAGEYRITARAGDRRSEPATVGLTSDAPAEVELVLKSDVIVRGRFGNGQMPVVAAGIYAIPRDTQWAPFMPQAMTTERGRFQLELPPRTTLYDLVAVHPAFDIVLTRLTAHPESVRQIVATQMGGTLVVHSQSPADLLLRHGGGECWLSWLARLPGAGGAVESARIVLPRLEPGDYSVCSAKSNECARGYLPTHGTLTLKMDREPIKD